MVKSNKILFIVLHIIAWLIFVGLSIEACGLIVNFIFSVFKPGSVQYLYQKLDLSNIYHQSESAFYGMYSFILIVAMLKAYLFYIVIMLMHKMDINNPFNSFVSKQITKIAYYTLSIGILSYIARQTAKNLQARGFAVENLNQFWGDSQAFVFMAAVIYVIATIFKKGVDLQNENDLTV